MYLWFIAAFAAAFVKGLAGFANTLVFTSILGFFETNVDISPVELVMHYPANMLMVYKHRKHLRASVYLPLICFVMAGSIPGAFLLKGVDTTVLKIVFGALVVFIGLEMLAREYLKYSIRESRLLLGGIGIASGLMSGMFGIGALLAAYVSRVTKSQDEFKANISMVFTAECTFRIILYSCIGVITLSTLTKTAMLLPAMLLGLFSGIKLSSRVNERTVKTIVMVLLIISGAILVIKNL